MKDRTINWFDHSVQSMEAQLPWSKKQGPYLVERLSALLLERLPPETSQAILNLLPVQNIQTYFYGRLERLQNSAVSGADFSIGYHDFIQRASLALGVCEISLKGSRTLAESGLLYFGEKVADNFLWSVAQEFPPELKQTLLNQLPAELKNRMDLFSSHVDEAKVA
jgi:hypothetical protein